MFLLQCPHGEPLYFAFAHGYCRCMPLPLAVAKFVPLVEECACDTAAYTRLGGSVID